MLNWFTSLTTKRVWLCIHHLSKLQDQALVVSGLLLWWCVLGLDSKLSRQAFAWRTEWKYKALEVDQIWTCLYMRGSCTDFYKALLFPAPSCVHHSQLLKCSHSCCCFLFSVFPTHLFSPLCGAVQQISWLQSYSIKELASTSLISRQEASWEEKKRDIAGVFEWLHM